MVYPNFSAHWVIPEKIHTPTTEEVFFYPPSHLDFLRPKTPPSCLDFQEKRPLLPPGFQGKKGVKVNQLFTFFTSIITRNNRDLT